MERQINQIDLMPYNHTDFILISVVTLFSFFAVSVLNPSVHPE